MGRRQVDRSGVVVGRGSLTVCGSIRPLRLRRRRCPHSAGRAAGLGVAAWMLASSAGAAPPNLDQVLRDQAARIATIQRVAPAVVCVFDADFSGGGSGVLIDASGYGLTNFHMVAGMMGERRGWGALSDGKKYELEVLGIDPTGDVAMFRLVGRKDFPFAPLGDSNAVRVGDTVMAMGNPFSLSDDYAPTVTMGLVTGVHRYQWGVGKNLAYTDCLQVDASINPGNSGGPLFNSDGAVIGINGRISVNTRGRFNVGFGYAISSNQIKMFIPALRAGLLTRHGTLLATVDDRDGVMFVEAAPDGAADRAGIAPGDRLIAIDDIRITSTNRFVSVMGTYPAHRHVRLDIVSDGIPKRVTVRLDPIDPDLKKPYEAPEALIKREIRRLIARFQETILPRGAALPQAIHCDVVRETSGLPGALRFRSHGFREGRLKYEAIRSDGSRGKTIHFENAEARARTRAGGDWFTMATEEQLIYGAFFVAQQFMLVPAEEWNPADLTHLGGDRLLPRREEDAAFEIEDAAVVAWRLSEDVTARLLLGTRTGLLRRVVVDDEPSGRRVAVDFRDLRNIDGMRLPETVDVYGTGVSFTETLSHWEMTRP